APVHILRDSDTQRHWDARVLMLGSRVACAHQTACAAVLHVHGYIGECLIEEKEKVPVFPLGDAGLPRCVCGRLVKASQAFAVDRKQQRSVVRRPPLSETSERTSFW
ncbi:hypothetical protein KUCAC02_037079, partial [Chaenocephalus aceratus]